MSIKSKADTAYRDFVTPALPASGEHEPPKPDIRSLFSEVQSLGFPTLDSAVADIASPDAEIVTTRDVSATAKSLSDADWRRIPMPTVIKPWHWQDAAGKWHSPRGREVHPDSFGVVDPSGAVSSQAAFSTAFACGADPAIRRPIVIPPGDALTISGLDIDWRHNVYGSGEGNTKLKLATGSAHMFRFVWSPISVGGGNHYLLPKLEDFSIDGNAAGQTRPTATVTISIAAPGVVTWAAHGLPVDTMVIFSTTGALPTGLFAGVVYYVRNPALNTFQLSATKGGTVSINTSGTQSGVHTATESADRYAVLYFPSDSAANVNSATDYGFTAKLRDIQIENVYQDAIFIGDNRNKITFTDMVLRAGGRDGVRLLSCGDHDLTQVNIGSFTGAGIQNAGAFDLDLTNVSSYDNGNAYIHGQAAQNVKWAGGTIDRSRNTAVQIVGYTPGNVPTAGNWAVDIAVKMALNGNDTADHIFEVFGDRPLSIDVQGYDAAPISARLIQVSSARTMPINLRLNINEAALPWSIEVCNQPELIANIVGVGATIGQRGGAATLSLETIVSGVLSEMARFSNVSLDFKRSAKVDGSTLSFSIIDQASATGRRNFRFIVVAGVLYIQQMNDAGSTVTATLLSLEWDGTNVIPRLPGLRTSAPGGASGVWKNGGALAIT
jgi:hypothetical protein